MESGEWRVKREKVLWSKNKKVVKYEQVSPFFERKKREREEGGRYSTSLGDKGR